MLLALSMSGWTLVPVLLWVWVQPTSLAMAETSWQHELLQGADASGSAWFLALPPLMKRHIAAGALHAASLPMS